MTCPAPLTLAAIDADTLSVGVLVVGLIALTGLGLNVFHLFRLMSGREGERQIEPTQLHAISSELKAQTQTLNKLDREVGETKAEVQTITRNISELKQDHRQETVGIHTRISGISRELAGTSVRVDGLERREGRPQ